MRNPQLVDCLQRAIGYHFKEFELLERALTHRSHSKNHNERLEFLGDAILNAKIAEILYEKYKKLPEGKLSAMRSILVRKEALAKVGNQLQLSELLRVGGGAVKTGGHHLDSVIADSVEALIGAVHLEGGWNNSSKVIGILFSPLVAVVSDAPIRDAKSLLQELLQSRGFALPVYSADKISGPGHAQKFDIFCEIEPLTEKYFGRGSSRRIAEQEAAAKALTALKTEWEP